MTRGKDARDFQRRSLSRFLTSRASRYASHPTFLVANAFALRVFNASHTFSFFQKERKNERKGEIRKGKKKKERKKERKKEGKKESQK